MSETIRVMPKSEPQKKSQEINPEMIINMAREISFLKDVVSMLSRNIDNVIDDIEQCDSNLVYLHEQLVEKKILDKPETKRDKQDG